MKYSKKSLLIIHKTQFGYLTDVYKWCQYLRNEYDITVVSLNQGFAQVSLDGVKVIDVCGKKYYYRGISFLIRSIIEILKCKGVVVLCYFEEVELLRRFFPKKKMILDIRTLGVGEDDEKRKKHDSKLGMLLPRFSNVTVISEGIKLLLGENAKSAYVIPLGADIRQTDLIKNKSPRLLYVGTLSNRRIEDTIKGLKIFVDNNQELDIIYDIIGDGRTNELEKLKELVAELELQKYVIFHGRIPNDKIGPFLDKSNIGVSYIPITEYYDYQPPTKTFEYVLAGLLCLATATHCNKELITAKNGCLIQDTPEAFADGLKCCCEKLKSYNPKIVRQTLSNYTWENIVNKKLKVVLDNAM